jgi:hypothetical protein
MFTWLQEARIAEMALRLPRSPIVVHDRLAVLSAHQISAKAVSGALDARPTSSMRLHINRAPRISQVKPARDRFEALCGWRRAAATTRSAHSTISRISGAMSLAGQPRAFERACLKAFKAVSR